MMKNLFAIYCKKWCGPCKCCDKIEYNCVKGSVLIYQCLLFIFGCLIISNGAKQVDSMTYFIMFVSDRGSFNAAIAFIVCGIVLLLIVLLGIWGIVFQDKKIMKIFFVVLIITLFVEICTSIAILSFKGYDPETVKQDMDNFLFRHNSSSEINMLYAFQVKHDCCGFQNITECHFKISCYDKVKNYVISSRQVFDYAPFSVGMGLFHFFIAFIAYFLYQYHSKRNNPKYNIPI